MDLITFAIPVFFLLIGIELLIQRLGKTRLYRLNDTVANINCGILSQVTGALCKTALAVGYFYIYENFKIFDLPNNALTFILLFIGVDFFYYWFHRLSHEVNFMWGAHIVHHQSEEYNLSVALRQSSLQAFFSFVFYLPLAWIGFSPYYFITISSIQTLYQFWIHTKTIKFLPKPVEFVFNTPSHHRVHHGRNPRYIDKNHGGTLIIFDRIFGTFQKEEEEVIYGVTKPLNSWNAFWANIDYYKDLWHTVKAARGVRDKLAVLVKPPGWRPDYLGGPLEPADITPESASVYDTRVSSQVNYYVLYQFSVLLVYASIFLFMFDAYTIPMRAVVSVLILWTVITLGRVLENKRSLFIELIRQTIMLATIPFLPFTTAMIVAFTIMCAAGLLWTYLLRNELNRVILAYEMDTE